MGSEAQASAPGNPGSAGDLPLPRPRRPDHVDRARSYCVVDEAACRVRVSDLDFAAYLLMHSTSSRQPRGLAIVDAVRVGDHESHYDFYDPDHRIADLSLAYASSEASRFAECVRRLKKSVYAVPRSQLEGHSASRRSR